MARCSSSGFVVIVVLATLATGCGDKNAPPAQPPPQVAPYRGGYRLPVKGVWKVHRTHYKNKGDQAFAVDLVLNGPYPLGRVPLDQFASYRQPIVADGPGVIAIVVDGVPDNEIGVRNGYAAHGNYVVIDHRNGEYSVFAHFIPGSVKVRVGQVVAMGQVLGACGNSGNSSMPHLHYQIIDHPQPHMAKARPIRHAAYKKNGRLSTARMEKGDLIEWVEE